MKNVQYVTLLIGILILSTLFFTTMELGLQIRAALTAFEYEVHPIAARIPIKRRKSLMLWLSGI
ncbi:MAG: hypothetical protein IPL27_07265 [Lewinellaceae bacterium]|nr:hypothetical protein [Lewinellaceae bacterium]